MVEDVTILVDRPNSVSLCFHCRRFDLCSGPFDQEALVVRHFDQPPSLILDMCRNLACENGSIPEIGFLLLS